MRHYQNSSHASQKPTSRLHRAAGPVHEAGIIDLRIWYIHHQSMAILSTSRPGARKSSRCSVAGVYWVCFLLFAH